MLRHLYTVPSNSRAIVKSLISCQKMHGGSAAVKDNINQMQQAAAFVVDNDVTLTC